MTTAGTFDLWTTSVFGPSGTTPFDPELFLFSGLGTSGTLLGADDDGCVSSLFISQCGPASSSDITIMGLNSILNDIALSIGDYTIAVGAFNTNEAETRSGVNADNIASGDFAVRVASLELFGGGTGVATAVPEPASGLLVGAGLAGLGLLARRRRQR